MNVPAQIELALTLAQLDESLHISPRHARSLVASGRLLVSLALRLWRAPKLRAAFDLRKNRAVILRRVAGIASRRASPGVAFSYCPMGRQGDGPERTVQNAKSQIRQ